MTIQEKIKDHVIGASVAATFTILAATLVWQWEGFIENYIQPQIQKSLARDGYLQEEVKSGRFVVTNDNEFAKNQVIPSSKLVELKEGGFALKKSLAISNEDTKSIERELSSRIDDLVKENTALKSHLVRLESANSELQAYFNVIASKKLKVELFVSERDADKGKIILNINNVVIANALENNSSYKVFGSNGDYERLITRIEVSTDSKRPQNAASGRVHEDDYHDLFDGATSGARIATIELK